jgi:hypothetical protein
VLRQIEKVTPLDLKIIFGIELVFEISGKINRRLVIWKG